MACCMPSCRRSLTRCTNVDQIRISSRTVLRLAVAAAARRPPRVTVQVFAGYVKGWELQLPDSYRVFYVLHICTRQAQFR
eukprot:2774782-Pleurochrysis_carterae.AAC.5